MNILTQARAMPEFLKVLTRGMPDPVKPKERQFLGEKVKPYISPTFLRKPEASIQGVSGFLGGLISPLHTIPTAVSQRSRLAGGAARENLPSTFPFLVKQKRRLEEAKPSPLEETLLEGGKKDWEKFKEKGRDLWIPDFLKNVFEKQKESFEGQQEITRQFGGKVVQNLVESGNERSYGVKKQKDVDRVVQILNEQGAHDLAIVRLENLHSGDREFIKEAQEKRFMSMLGTMMGTTSPVAGTGEIGKSALPWSRRPVESSVHTREGLIKTLKKRGFETEINLKGMSVPELKNLLSKSTESGRAWLPGIKKQFDTALLKGDANKIRELLPQVPESYATKFADKISKILSSVTRRTQGGIPTVF